MAALCAMPPTANATLGSYPDTIVRLGANKAITPNAAPTHTTGIHVSAPTEFKGLVEGDPTTGIVRVTDAHPAGTYLITITGFPSNGESAMTFNLTVTARPHCNPISFVAPANFTAGTGPRAVRVGDFNRDGRQDLVVANSESDNLSILLGDGTGGFSSATHLAVGDFPYSIAIGDFDGDGKQDLAVANRTSSSVSVLGGDGSGQFTATVTLNTEYTPTSIVIGDFNRDGKPDLAVANGSSDSVAIFLGDGMGNFGEAGRFAVGDFPVSIAVGRFNADSATDLVTANQIGNNVSLLLGHGTGSFGPVVNRSVEETPFSIVVGDFARDGKQDIAVANYGSSSVSVLFGNGAGGFGAATSFDAGSNPRALAAADIDGDGGDDLAIANAAADKVSVLLSTGSADFAQPLGFNVAENPVSIAAGDFNADGMLDLVTANEFSNQDGSNVSVLLRECQSLLTTPAISTQASGTIVAGGTVYDSASLAGGAAPTGTITFDLYGPNDATCAGAPVFSSTKTVNDNGDYISDSFMPRSAGTYRFIASYSGDGNNHPVSGVCNDANESVQVIKATPAISTQASGTTAFGGTISDSATLSGGATPSGTITFNVYGPDNATCAGSPVFTSTKTVNGNGDYTSDSFMPGSAGTYRFIVRYSGDGNNNPVSGACDDANESVQVTKATPAISTQASGDIAFGGTVSDSASLSGGATPSGTITFDLYGPNDANCGGASVFTSTKPVSGNSTYGSDSFTPPSAGVYRWIARYSGDANNQPAAGVCNDANETVNVTKAATSVAVSSSANPSNFGQSVTFTAGVGSKAVGARTGTVQFEVDGERAGGAKVLDQSGRATFTTSSLSAGNHTIAAYYSGDANFFASADKLFRDQVVNPTPPTPGFGRLSTRARVETGDNVLISGFNVTGNASKEVLVRALGPSLTVSGAPIPGRLADPIVELRDGNGTVIASNDNWRDSAEAAAIQATGEAPPNDLESAILITIPPGNYLTIVTGKDATIGVGLAEIIDLHTSTGSQLTAILSRAYVGTQGEVIVGGFVIEGTQSQKVVLRGLGPSQASIGVANALADPTLELRDGNGALLVVNNDWQDNPAQAGAIGAAGLAPSDSKESAIAAILPPGSYSAVLAGLCNGTGVGLVEVYNFGLAGNTTEIPPSSPLPTCSPTPTPTPPQGVNISTRGRVETGENVLIGGFIITGQSPRKVMIRAMGPSLKAARVPDPLLDPTLTLHAADGSVIRANDDWKDAQRPEIEATGIPPGDDRESAVVATLPPGNYTAIVAGKNQTSGVGLLEIYDLDQAVDSKLANISTRGIIRTGDNVLIGGFIFGDNNGPTDVVVRAIGPSLTKAGINNALADPTLTLHNSDGSIMTSNDDWKDGPQANEIKRKNLAPTDNRESAIAITELPPGSYTAIVRGKDGATGIGLVEIYDLR